MTTQASRAHGAMRSSVALAALLLTAGCLASEPLAADVTVLPSATKPAVIAVIDTGTNPHYEVFERFDLPAPAIGEIPLLPLSSHEDWEERRRQDQENFRQVEIGRLYGFENKRLLVITFGSENPRGPVLDGSRHGSTTTYLAARSAPEAWIVSIQIDAGSCVPPPCGASPSTVKAMQWAAEQAWIDVISVSLGPPASMPLVEAAREDAADFVEASRAAASRGKLVVMAGGNQPVPAIADHFAGPPWVIAVGGADAVKRGEHYSAAKLVDVVANYTEYAPDPYDLDSSEWRLGTSFATPNVAASLARAISITRADGARLWPHGALAADADGKPLDSEAFRAALNATAEYYSATEWNPSASRGELVIDVATQALPILVQPQMGWGYVNSTMGEEIARRVLEGDFSIPLGKEQGRAFQEQWQRAREDYWSR